MGVVRSMSLLWTAEHLMLLITNIILNQSWIFLILFHMYIYLTQGQYSH